MPSPLPDASLARILGGSRVSGPWTLGLGGGASASFDPVTLRVRLHLDGGAAAGLAEILGAAGGAVPGPAGWAMRGLARRIRAADREGGGITLAPSGPLGLGPIRLVPGAGKAGSAPS
jgi:hypothetical protein